MLDNSKAPLNAITSSGVGLVEPLLGTIQLATERGDEPIVAGIASIPQDHWARKNSLSTDFKFLPERRFLQDL